jgi:hypothetical protein
MQISYLYLLVLIKWAEKLSPAIAIQNGLFFGGSEEKVEYPLRTYKTICNLGFLSLAFNNLPDSDFKTKHLKTVSELLISTIVNNPSSQRPLLDNQIIEIFFGFCGLANAGKVDIAKRWITGIFENLSIRKRYMNRLPELYNNLNSVIEYEATDERPIEYQDSSSTLIYFLFELCLILNCKDVYNSFRTEFLDINFQVWYPPENVEDLLYLQEIHEGDTETINHLPENFDDFLADVEARHLNDKTSCYFQSNSLPIMQLLACKHYRTPIFPLWWRSILFDANDNS